MFVRKDVRVLYKHYVLHIPDVFTITYLQLPQGAGGYGGTADASVHERTEPDLYAAV